MARISTKALKKLSDKEEAFLDNLTSPEFSDDMDGLVKAYIASGWSDGPSARSNARTKARELSDHIQIRIFEKIGAHIPWALHELIQLVKTTRNDQVKLKALFGILDRGGYNSPITIEHKKDDPSELSRDELRKEIMLIFNRLKGDKPDLHVVGGTDIEGK